MPAFSTMVGIGTLANRPAAGSAGKLYFAQDNNVTYRDNGTGWDTWSAPASSGSGGIGWAPFTDPTTQAWAWQNQGSATITSGNKIEFLKCPREATSGANLRGRSIAVAATPYTYTACFLPAMIKEPFQGYGLFLYNSTSGDLIVFRVNDESTNPPTFAVDTYTSFALAGKLAVLESETNFPIHWMQIQDDGTHRTYRWSPDGFNWLQFYQEASGTFIVPTNVGYFLFAAVSTSNNVDSGVSLVSWAKT